MPPPNTVSNYRVGSGPPLDVPILMERQLELVKAGTIEGQLETLFEAKESQMVLEGTCLNCTPDRAEQMHEMITAVFGKSKVGFTSVEVLATHPFSEAAFDLLRCSEEVIVPVAPFAMCCTDFETSSADEDDYRRLFRRLQGAGVEPSIRIFAGIPGQTLESILETMRFAYSLSPADVRVRLLTAVPGGPLAQRLETLDVVINPEPPHVVHSHPTADPMVLRWMVEIARMSARSHRYWKRSLAKRKALDVAEG